MVYYYEVVHRIWFNKGNYEICLLYSKILFKGIINWLWWQIILNIAVLQKHFSFLVKKYSIIIARMKFAMAWNTILINKIT